MQKFYGYATEEEEEIGNLLDENAQLHERIRKLQEELDDYKKLVERYEEECS